MNQIIVIITNIVVILIVTPSILVGGRQDFRQIII
jgi:hypothetical protein